ncbi:unnamed protein product [Brassica napus]|uniref:(rape) hypothetical protein n=1 Tax=Brassica napus TaxID=3708 RepID=A0A816J281_BRANA|nr:unnamed protein product [Brassica napus]
MDKSSKNYKFLHSLNFCMSSFLPHSFQMCRFLFDLTSNFSIIHSRPCFHAIMYENTK